MKKKAGVGSWCSELVLGAGVGSWCWNEAVSNVQSAESEATKCLVRARARVRARVRVRVRRR